MQKISRKKTIEGTRVPGIIKNGQYFYINLDVYEDGMINCWELVDIEGLKEKLRINWLLPQVPDGENISIHGLGAYKIQTADWKYDKNSYFKYIKQTIKLLNPKMKNIYTISNEEKELHQRRKIVHSPQAEEFYEKNQLFYQTIKGKGISVFFKNNGKNYLVNVVVYKDGRVTVYNSEFELSFELENVYELFNNGTFFTNYNVPVRVVFDNFGEATLSDAMYAADIEEKYKELVDIHQQLNDKETSLEKCRKAYHEYLEYPTEFARARLKELYELASSLYFVA